MSRYLHRLAAAVAVVLAVATGSSALAQEDPKELRVSIFTNYLPVSGLDLTGNASGLLPDIWQLWAQKTGVPVSFVLSENFADSVASVMDGKADVHSGLFWSEDRAAVLDYSRTLFEFSSTMYYWRDRGAAPKLSDLRGKKVGVLGGTYQFNFLAKSHLGVEPVPFNLPEDMLRALARGQVDAVLHEDVAMSSLLVRLGISGEVGKASLNLIRNGARPAVRKGNNDIKALVDWGMSQITNDELAELEDRWIGDREGAYARLPGNKLAFTEGEKTWLAQHEKIRVGMQQDWPPVNATQAGGTPKGMSPEFLEAIVERFDNKIELVPGRWNELLDQVRRGELDAVMDITATRSRMADFNFTSPYLTIPHVFVTGSADLKIASHDDLNGRSLALEEGYASVEAIRASHPDITVKTYPGTLAALNAVARGEADAWRGNEAVASYLIGQNEETLGGLTIGAPVPRVSSVLSIGTRRDAPILRDIFEKGIIGVDAERRQRITEPWLHGTVASSIRLTAEEQRWLIDHRNRKIRVLVDDWPPFGYMEDGEAKGISVAYIRYIFDVLGLDYEFVEMPWQEALTAIANRDGIDVIPDIAQSPSRAKNIAFTEPYLSFPFVIFMRSNEGIVGGLTDLAGKTVAVEAGFITEEKLRADFPEINLLPVPNTHHALEAVSLGKADAYVGNLAAGSYHIEKHGMSNIKVAAPTQYAEDKQSMGVRKDWPELASLIGRVLTQMTDEQNTQLRSSAMAIRYEFGLDLEEVLTYAVPIGAGVLAIIVIFVYANRKLTREVAERQAAEAGLREREARFKALLESAPDATIIVAPDGTITTANHQAEILFQGIREDIVGRSVDDFVPERIKHLHADYRKSFMSARDAREMGAGLSLVARRLDGSEFPVEISLSPISTPEGKLVAASIRDVTERRRAAEIMKEKDIQLTAALENMTGGIMMADADFNIRVFNRKYVEMLKLPDVHVGMPLRDVLMIRAARGEFGEGDATEIAEERLAKIRSGEFARSEDVVPDGRTIETIRQWTDDGGVVSIFNDITDRKMAESALASQTKRLQDLSNKLSRYLSPQIYEAIFAGAADAEVTTSRKKLTVFFSDIKNFTSTTEEMEPEDMTFLLNDYLTKMTEIALEYGGTIDKYIGDAIMVFFGDPETKGVKQDALAAVRMAVAMQRRMHDLRAKWADMGFRLPFHIRCGINTGYCNVGNFGSDQRIDYTIIGGQVNLAARLEGICEPDGIAMSYETYSLVRDEFDADPLEPIMVKGIHEPVTPYALKGVLDDWDADERYIRRDDVKGLRIWVDLMRMSDEQRQDAIRELEETLDILKDKKTDAADD